VLEGVEAKGPVLRCRLKQEDGPPAEVVLVLAPLHQALVERAVQVNEAETLTFLNELPDQVFEQARFALIRRADHMGMGAEIFLAKQKVFAVRLADPHGTPPAPCL
jgi:hypothetical protein